MISEIEYKGLKLLTEGKGWPWDTEGRPSPWYSLLLSGYYRIGKNGCHILTRKGEIALAIYEAATGVQQNQSRY